MSDYSTTILTFVLLAHVVGYGTSTLADQETSSLSVANPNAQNEQDNNNHNNNIRQQSYLLDGQSSNFRASVGTRQPTNMKSIDLIELTPSLEQQLYQAKRLNSGDPGTVLELGKLANDAYRYDVADQQDQLNQAAEERPLASQGRFQRQLMDGIHRLDEARRLNNNNNENSGRVSSSPLVNTNYGNELQQRFSRGLATAYDEAESAAANSRVGSEQDKDYGALVNMPSSSPAFIDNQESASRKSLWTSELLRDLLIAQEARNRARLIEKLARAYDRERGIGTNPAGVVGLNVAKASNREKRRRCKVDPNLGVKNPSFCDTDAYFGAADYSMRDVWDSAGR